MQRIFSTEGTSPFDQVRWERRTAEIKDDKGQVVFEQDGVEVPKFYSKLATDIVASKYFYGAKGTPARETGVRQLISRVVDTITSWGSKGGYFDAEGAKVFNDELTYLCLNQYGAFNSPVWFNVGLSHEYGIEGPPNNWRWDAGIPDGDPYDGPRSCARAAAAVPCEDAYRYPQGSACFIQAVDDDMRDIMALATSEAMLFKYGSGTGTDLSTLRSSRELLAGGGKPSGPVSFMRVFDSIAGVVKSGGKCLAYDQPVFTAGGVKSAKDLAESGTKFVVLSYSKRLGRVAAKEASAWSSGVKPGVEVTTDKGTFRVSDDHPFMLRTGVVVRAKDLVAGSRLLATSVYEHPQGYPWVKNAVDDSRMLLHRMVAADVCRWDIGGKVVRHKETPVTDCTPGNLQCFATQADHAKHHGIGRGSFFTEGSPGASNGMHHTSSFWQDTDRSDAYRATQGAILTASGRARVMQSAAARQKMLNLGYELINAGHDVSSFESYCEARLRHGRRVPHKGKQAEKFNDQFGSYADFLVALSAGNHRVLGVRPLGVIGVVSVEVLDDEPDDKRDWNEHNYALCPLGTTQPYGTLVFTSNTRRAAKMQTLKVHHPDILEFIECKTKEDRKAQALIKQGYSADFNGDAYGSVCFQNANLSVRATDEFMGLAQAGRGWQTREVVSGKPSVTYNADDLMGRIAEGTWACGDPGMQFEDTIQRWHTCPNSGAINSSNPCSEYMFLDDSACNLASINLMKFRDRDGGFDAARFKAACSIFLLAQEILVDNVSYPTKAICENSHKFRPLGLGYANLGCLLMSLGLPYDSEAGRDMAGAITALMHGAANVTSATLAGRLGPFESFEVNREPMLKVMGMHLDVAVAASEGPKTAASHTMWAAAISGLQEAIRLGEVYGYRNSQVTLLAPTGTIAFMMDCDTTGVEPDIALVKYKKLAGGGLLKIVNKTVPLALEKLGYYDADIKAIVDHIDARDTIEGGGLLEEHLPVFDCAFPPANGGRSIGWEGHVRMLAAVQPFLSGAISKTVNLPHDSTPADIRRAYYLCWKLGVKAAAIYRNDSKGSQPLNTSKDADEAPDARRAEREPLPNERAALTHKFDIQGHEGYVNVGFYPDGRTGELFITMAKEGSTIGGLMDTIGTAVSIGLQYGVPLEAFVKKFAHTRFEPAGFTKNPDIPIAKSITDYLFRWLGIKFLPGYREANVPKREETPAPAAKAEPIPIKVPYHQADAPACSECGSITVRNGTCYRCMNCGSSMGCS